MIAKSQRAGSPPVSGVAAGERITDERTRIADVRGALVVARAGGTSGQALDAGPRLGLGDLVVAEERQPAVRKAVLTRRSELAARRADPLGALGRRPTRDDRAAVA